MTGESLKIPSDTGNSVFEEFFPYNLIYQMKVISLGYLFEIFQEPLEAPQI